MKIKFVQSGGIAGLTKEAEIDTDKTSKDETKFYQKIIDKSKFFQLQSKDTVPKPDMEQIFITVEKEGQSHMVQLNILNIPKDLNPLIDDLKKRAQIKKH